LTIAVFLGVGIWCLTQATSIQRHAVEASEKMNLKLFRGYISSRSHLIVTRIAGGACIVIALLLGLTLVRR